MPCTKKLAQPLLVMLAAAIAATGPAAAETPECAALTRSVVDARASRDLNLVQSAIAAVTRSVGVCEAKEIEAIKREAALAYYDRATAKETTEAEAERLLREGLKLERPWRMSATLGDIEFNRRNFAAAASLYQDALDDIRDVAANPVAPSTKIIEGIVKRAETASLMSPVYVARLDKKRGKPGGLAEPNTRGFIAKKTGVPIQFKYKETEFTEEGAKAASDLLTYLNSQNATQIKLIGHTDDKGGRDYNLDLSARRAQAVADFLKKNGFAGTIVTAGKGFDDPYKDDGSLQLTKAEHDQLNRRVELER